MEIQNTIELFGYVIKPIHIQVATYVTMLLFGTVGIFVYRRLKKRWDTRGGRQLDHYLDSVTEASDPDADGYRTCIIRNKGKGERLEEVVRGEKERNWLVTAAKNCDWKHRFLKNTNAKEQDRMLHVIHNAITRHFVDGYNAHDAELPTKAVDYYFAPTGAEAAVGSIRMFRILMATKATLKIFDEWPADKWKFEKDKVTGKPKNHAVRVTSMREMAEALFRNNGCKEYKGKMVQIIGWVEGRVRA